MLKKKIWILVISVIVIIIAIMSYINISNKAERDSIYFSLLKDMDFKFKLLSDTTSNSGDFHCLRHTSKSLMDYKKLLKSHGTKYNEKRFFDLSNKHNVRDEVIKNFKIHYNNDLCIFMCQSRNRNSNFFIKKNRMF